MKITDIKLLILENPEQKRGGHRLVQVPGLHRIQYTHKGVPGHQPARLHIIEVHTDAGIVGRMAPTSITPAQAEILLHSHVVGENPFHRERLFQMLQKGTRWVYQEPGWFGEFDNCLWDIAGQVAGLPVHALIGRVRERLPVYLTGGAICPTSTAGGRMAWRPTNSTATKGVRPTSPSIAPCARRWATTTR